MERVRKKKTERRKKVSIAIVSISAAWDLVPADSEVRNGKMIRFLPYIFSKQLMDKK
jgi:hypothetical protein